MKIYSLLLSMGLFLIVLSCETLPVRNKPATEVPANEDGEAGSVNNGLQGPSQPFIESPEEPPEESPEESPELIGRETHTGEVLKLTGIEDLPDRLSSEEKTIPGTENIPLPEVPEIRRDPYRDILTANDLDPDEPDHYYLRRKPIAEFRTEGLRNDKVSTGEIPPEKKEIPGRKNRPDSRAKVVVEEVSGTEGGKARGVLQAEEQYSSSSAREAPETPKNSDTPDFEIDAVTGEKIQISLTDHSWVYDRSSSSPGGVEFEGTQYLQDSKEFLFQALQAGEYILSFTKPDFNTGRVEKRTVAVTIGEVQEDGAQASVDDILAAGRKTSGPPGHEKGSFSAESLRSGISDRDRTVIERQLYLLVDYFSTGRSNSDDPEVEEKSVTAGTLFDEGMWSAVLDGAGQLEDTRSEPAAEGALQLFLTHAADRFERLGEVYYLLGRIYETPIPPRDEKKAVEYYGQVLEIYPADIYHFKAEERIKYLERHFIQIR